MLKITLTLDEDKHYKDWEYAFIAEDICQILRGVLYSRLEAKSMELVKGSKIKDDPRLKLIHEESLRIYDQEIEIAKDLLKNISIKQI